MSVDRNALAEAGARGEVLPVNLDAKFLVTLLTLDRLIVSAGFVLKNSLKTDGGEEVHPLHIECSFSALFHLGAPCDGKSADHFANTEAKLIFWPYLRHFISDISYRMAINPLVIPLITSVNDSTPAEK
jgi:hypothetical protein